MADGDAAALPPGGGDTACQAERSELARDPPLSTGLVRVSVTATLDPKPLTPDTDRDSDPELDPDPEPEPEPEPDTDPISRPEIYRLQLRSLAPKPKLKAEDFVLSFELRKGA